MHNALILLALAVLTGATLVPAEIAGALRVAVSLGCLVAGGATLIGMAIKKAR